MLKSDIWLRTLAPQGDEYEVDREILRVELLSFREKVANLVSTIAAELPGLTVHDITHLDALWDVADEVIGPSYPLNPAEAFVLGGAFLLHDAAHVLAAYEDGKSSVKASEVWHDYIALRFGGKDPQDGTADEKLALFNVLRHLHAAQAEKLPFMAWGPTKNKQEYLINNPEIRNYFGDAIGQVAASHHWDPDRVAEIFDRRIVAPPAFLRKSKWDVDLLKIAMMLRLADAAHIDSRRAPWFLFNLRNPEGVSKDHWLFQTKLGRLKRQENGEMKISSGPHFSESERSAWWLAFDAANMIDAELKSAAKILGAHGRQSFPAVGVTGCSSATEFSRYLPVKGWVPIDVKPIVSDVPSLVERFGGAAMYGEDPSIALRELIQNGMDACRAHSSILNLPGRRVLVELARSSGGWSLRVNDNGVGMSRNVLTSTLLDFGKSLWSSGEVMSELPGLAKSGFVPAGKFGIGFYSVFMLSDAVSVTTRRYERAAIDSHDQWMLKFDGGLRARPALHNPTGAQKLKDCGTVVEAALVQELVLELLRLDAEKLESDGLNALATSISRQAPAADVDIYVSFCGSDPVKVVAANDWLEIADADLLARIDARTDSSLVKLIGKDGRVLGRLSPAARFDYRARGVGVVNGLSATSTDGFTGVVRVRGNNTDAKRTRARLAGTPEDWAHWARAWLALESGDAHRNAVVHPFIPADDLHVWSMAGELHTLEGLERKVSSLVQVILHLGDVSHDDEDDMSSSRFDSSFRLDSGVVIGPDDYYQKGSYAENFYLESFPWSIGVSRIDYVKRFEDMLHSIWGGYEREDDFDVVGYVDGIPIEREVVRFLRPEKAPV